MDLLLKRKQNSSILRVRLNGSDMRIAVAFSGKGMENLFQIGNGKVKGGMND